MTHMLFYTGHGLSEEAALRNPSFDHIVKDYCGITLSELVIKEDSDYETRSFWTGINIEPTLLQKILVEMLHLAYTRGEEL